MSIVRSRSRRIVIDGVPYRYSRTHRHEIGPAGTQICEEVLRAQPEDRGHTTLVLRFRDGDGGVTTAGEGWGGHDGGLLIDGEAVNLNLPSVVARLLRAARALGPPPPRGAWELNGFAIYRRSQPATP